VVFWTTDTGSARLSTVAGDGSVESTIDIGAVRQRSADTLIGAAPMTGENGYVLAFLDNARAGETRIYMVRTDRRGNILSKGGAPVYPDQTLMAAQLEALPDGQFFMASSTIGSSHESFGAGPILVNARSAGWGVSGMGSFRGDRALSVAGTAEAPVAVVGGGPGPRRIMSFDLTGGGSDLWTGWTPVDVHATAISSTGVDAILVGTDGRLVHMEEKHPTELDYSPDGDLVDVRYEPALDTFLAGWATPGHLTIRR
jgi:hypothetical protein